MPHDDDPPGTSRNGHHMMQMTPEQRQDFEDHSFLDYYITLPDMHDADERPAFHRLFHQQWMRHVKDIYERRPDLIQGKLATWANTQRPLGLWWPDLHKAIRETPAHEVLQLPYVPETLVPELPSEAYLDPQLGGHATPWLDAYIQYSKQWATRSADAFHEATGLWVLSTIAARRLCIAMGKRIYPGLYCAMVAQSGLFYKSTAAEIGTELVQHIGCGYLLAPDRPTPQSLLHIMSGAVSENFGSMNDDEQQIARFKLSFASQRGWYYDDWGGLLDQLVRRDSPMSMYHELFRVLDDGHDEFTTATLTRGEETIRGAYIAFLSSATPDDLAPFMKANAKWWRDGFWPRFAFAVPTPGEEPKMTPRPTGLPPQDCWLLTRLRQWHDALRLPACLVEPKTDHTGKQLAGYRRILGPFPCQTLGIDDQAKEAHDRYSNALTTLSRSPGFNPDLRSCYVRMPERALRIAMLLASIDDPLLNADDLEHQTIITLPYWAAAQTIVERQRRMLHQVIEMADQSQPKTREQLLEEKIVKLLADGGAMTARELMRHIHNSTSKDVGQALTNLERAGVVESLKDGKRQLYRLVQEEGAITEEETTETDAEVSL